MTEIPAAVRDTVETVTNIALGSPLYPTTPRDWPATELRLWSSVVVVSGAFSGTVTVTCRPDFAYQIAHKMLGIEAVAESLARDALSEHTNMIGGNIKSRLASDMGEACRLSIPETTSGYIPILFRTLHSEWCEIDGHTILVEIIEGAPDGTVS